MNADERAEQHSDDDEIIALAERLAAKYPAHNFRTISREEMNGEPGPRGETLFVVFTWNHTVINEPFFSDCLRFAVDPVTHYGLAREDAEEMDARNECDV